MKTFLPVSLMSMALFVSSCVTELRFVSPDYKGQRIKDATLAIVKLQSPPGVWNMDDFTDDFKGGNPSDTIAYLLYSELSEAVKKTTCFQNTELVDYSNKPELETRVFHVTKNDSILMQVPKDLSVSPFLDTKADFVLLIDRMSTSVFYVTSYSQYGGGTTKYLRFSVHYVILDLKANKTVAYGVANGDNSVMFAVTRQTWVDTVKYLIADVFHGTPFRKVY